MTGQIEADYESASISPTVQHNSDSLFQTTSMRNRFEVKSAIGLSVILLDPFSVVRLRDAMDQVTLTEVFYPTGACLAALVPVRL